MPSKTPRQAHFMSAVAHGWHPKGVDIPVSVAKEFHAADAGHKYGAKGRAFGGVAPSMMNPGGIMSQAFNPVAQTPINAQAQGVMDPAMQPPMGNLNAPGAGARGFKSGGEANGVSSAKKMTVGSLVSTVPGRTDLHLTHVPSGSYVIPADIVSGHGQGNTLAGMKFLHKKFGMEEPDATHKLARGGRADEHVGRPVKVKLAGGEIVVPPDKVHATMERLFKKKMTLDEAHKKMDSWVRESRKKLRRQLAKLPGPVVD